jgi:CheY-like chemotaxis protein
MTKGPIVIIEDDPDDRENYADALKEISIPNQILFFDGGLQALDYLSTTEEQPFIILSDINMPGMSGLELKKIMQDDPYLSAKGIPFVFISTNATKVSVRHAHALSVQGYFEKPLKMGEIKEMLRVLFEYWERCKHINNTF